MRIGIDCRFWNQTGVGRYTRNLVKNISKIDKKNEYVFFARDEDLDEISKNVGKSTKIVIADIPWHTLREQVFFPKLLEKEKLDLVHFPYFSIPVRYKGKFVTTIHDLILYHFSSGRASHLPFPLYVIKRESYKRIIKKAAFRAEKIIVPSDYVKKDVINTLEINDEKIVVTHEGIDPAFAGKVKPQKIEQLQDIPFFLYVGNAYPHKNLDFLIRAFKFFTKEFDEHKNMHLVLVGRPDYFYERIDKQIKSSNIVHLKEVNDKELKWLYQSAKALIAPSLSEGFSLPTIEALGQGCLVLASAIPVHREVLGKWAQYFDPKNDDDLIERMRAILTLEEGEIKIYKDNGIKHVKKYNWQVLARQTLKVYEGRVSL